MCCQTNVPKALTNWDRLPPSQEFYRKTRWPWSSFKSRSPKSERRKFFFHLFLALFFSANSSQVGPLARQRSWEHENPKNDGTYHVRSFVRSYVRYLPVHSCPTTVKEGRKMPPGKGDETQKCGSFQHWTKSSLTKSRVKGVVF